MRKLHAHSAVARAAATTGEAVEQVVQSTVEGRSLWQEAWRRLRRNRAAMVSLFVFAAIVLFAVLMPLLSPWDYYTPQWTALNLPPGLASGHWLGTDGLGRDLLVRVAWGCRISLMVGVVASLVSLVIGVLWGTVAGYAGGLIDTVMMRIVDILYSVPFIPFVIVLLVVFGRELILIFVAIGAVSWLDIARIVRGQTLALKHREFIDAARASGVRTPGILFRHLIPNLLGIVVIYVTLTIPTLILFEAFLSFLGLGVQPPMTSLGALVSDGASDLQAYPYLLIVPSLFLAAIIYSMNYIGDGLRDALDPKDR
ncbi:ABC transporter permease subunit [Solimonas marina]|uniref:Oligopeptide transport system permease protein OppC n=1 Tax=Solimonas marina TaxID=2714601 RepID=A0A969WGL7_9GAMM|nr:ABC transporter permease subunit [Solimonas marina]